MIVLVKLSMVRFRQFLVLSLAVMFLLASVGSAHVYATPPSLLAVVRGTDNGVYYDICSGPCQTPGTTSWSGWARLPGGTLSAPTLCQGEEGAGYADLLVRGTDNGIYHQHYIVSSLSSWGSSWDSPSGQTSDQPACVAVNISGAYYLYVVVRGTDNALYFNLYEPSLSKPWGTWVGLGGATNSPPTLIYDDYGSNPRLELFVRGTDNAIYHKAGTINSAGGVTWAGSWESAGGATPSAVTALWGGSDVVDAFVQGTNNAVYMDFMLLPTSGTGDTFTGWGAIGGATSMAMGRGWRR
jgi:hypothetical protein